jgi:hypothetical protein
MNITENHVHGPVAFEVRNHVRRVNAALTRIDLGELIARSIVNEERIVSGDELIFSVAVQITDDWRSVPTGLATEISYEHRRLHFANTLALGTGSVTVSPRRALRSASGPARARAIAANEHPKNSIT